IMLKHLGMVCLLGTTLWAQESNPQPPGDFSQRQASLPSAAYSVPPGTHILLNMINSISTKQAVVGDRIYLETAFPVMSNGKIVIPPGSWVTGTITEVKRPGRVKGRGELQVRFDSLTLPNGVSRDFRADLGAIDARDNQDLKREESKVGGPSNKGGDAGTVIGASASGAALGSVIGLGSGHPGAGAGIGAGAGAAAGLLGVLLTRGPNAILAKGSTVEMVLDRPLSFTENETDFRNAPSRAVLSEGGAPVQSQQRQRRWPLPY
ncbi:MAG: hypothetical protein JOY85_17885, partial [Acidobacteriaceae bacterium]|nr:hypothetical protein [Acidobacteriaceae bacterium]